MHVDRTSELESNVGQKVKNSGDAVCTIQGSAFVGAEVGSGSPRRRVFSSDAWNCSPCHSCVNPHLGLDR